MAFWKPGEKAPGVGIDRDLEKEPQLAIWNPNAQLSINQQRMRLPAFQKRTQILYLLEKYSTVVLVGQTGCGKTTQVPQYLHESGWTSGGRVVVCTQPRRVAATSVATRVAEEMGCTLGQEVGYSVRFDAMTSPETRIKYVTDGLLVREMMMDPLLSKYSVVMLDEAHERSLHTDILIGLLKKVQRKRKDLRLIISSATLDAEEMKAFFETNTTNDPKQDSAVIISIEGRTFPVDIHYLQQPCSDYLTTAMNTVVDIHNTQPHGDILVFLTGQEEIDTLVQLLKDKSGELLQKNKGMKLKPVPIYAGLPNEQQMKVFAPPKSEVRKVVIATNIAETSITIDGIVYVIDCGFVKIRTYSGRTGLESLVVVPSSQASCNQRAGRAGRNKMGKCYRLFTEEAFGTLAKQTVPEIQRTNLSPVVLQLKALGIDDVLHFDFISAPPARVMVRALELLYALGALDEQCKLTPVGIKLAEFPIEPAFAKMIFAAAAYGCMEEAISVAAMLSLQTVFMYPKDAKNQADQVRLKFAVHEGDHLTLLNVYNGFISHGQSSSWCHDRFINYKSMARAVEIRRQLAAYVKKFKLVDKNTPVTPPSTDDPTEGIRKAIIGGFFANAAHLQSDGSYLTVKDRHRLFLHPTSVVFKHPPEWVVFHEVMLTTKEYMRDVTAINPNWLAEIAPHFYVYKNQRK